MSSLQPTDEQVRQARDAVASRGWQESRSAGHDFYPRAIREDDGSYRPCEHCGAARNPARWPLFFTSGPHAGQILWTCSTCKLAQADRGGIATILVAPADPEVEGRLR